MNNILELINFLFLSVSILYPFVIVVLLISLIANVFYKNVILKNIIRVLYSLFVIGFLVIHLTNTQILFGEKRYDILLIKFLLVIILGVILSKCIFSKKSFSSIFPISFIIIYLICLYLSYYWV